MHAPPQTILGHVVDGKHLARSLGDAQVAGTLLDNTHIQIFRCAPVKSARVHAAKPPLPEALAVHQSV